MPDNPVPKVPPRDISSSASARVEEAENLEVEIEEEEPPPGPPSTPPPGRVKGPPPGVDPLKLSKQAHSSEGAAAAKAPQGEGPPKPKPYKAPPRPPYNYSVAAGEAYEPGIDPDPPVPSRAELDEAWEASKAEQDVQWERRVKQQEDRRNAKALEEYYRSQKQREKHNKVRPPPKQPPSGTPPPKPDRPVPRAPPTSSPKPSPPPSPKLSPPPTPPPSPKAAAPASASTASASVTEEESAARRAERLRRSAYLFHQAREQSLSSNLIVFFDWHDTLDCARNALNLFDQSIQDKFIRLVEVAKGRIEFHIVSFSGYNRGKQTFEDANNLAEDLRSRGLPFRSVTVVGDPVGPTGKTPVLTTAGAHILVDDREDICREASLSGLHAIQVYKSPRLQWWPQLESYVREHGVDWIIRNHSPVPLRPNQFLRGRG